MVKDKIEYLVLTAVEKAGYKLENVVVNAPTNENFGDYATPIALQLAKKEKKNPMEIAQQIGDLIENKMIEKVEIIKPGFINITIGKTYLFSNLKNILEDKQELPSYHLGKNKKIMVEFAHPNTHKLFHIGHLRNITTGESIIRILEAVGNKVIRANYQGDVGLHIAKALYGLQNLIKTQSLDEIRNLSLKEKIELLGKAYTKGSSFYESDDIARKEIIEINKNIYSQEEETLTLWKETREWSLEYFDNIYKRVFTHFDNLYFESQMAKSGLEIAHQAVKDGILEKSEGAIVLRGDKHNVDTRVFVNSLGLPTYEGKDLGLAKRQFNDYGELDKVIHVLGGEQQGYLKTVIKAIELIFPETKDKSYHLVYGWVDVKGMKMSSRKGNIVEGEWLLDEAKKQIIKEYNSKEEVAEKLAVAAVKYSFLKNGILTNVNFDLTDAITLQGDSGPYLIYTYVRCNSVINKFEGDILVPENIELNDDEAAILRALVKFPETVLEAAQNFAPNYICSYLFDLAQKYNNFYQKHSILDAKEDTKMLRLSITQAVAQTVKNGLYLLGIKTVEKM